MRVDRRDGGLVSLSLFLLVMLMIFSTKYCCRAAVLTEKKNNNTSFRCSGGDGGLLDDDDCNNSLIGDDMEIELLMDSYISRVLAGSNGKATVEFTNNAKKTPSCGQGKQYGPCMDGKKVADNCSTYNRTCQKK